VSGYVTQPGLGAGRILSSAELATAIKETDFSGCAATVIGYGYMGRQYVKALQILGVPRVRVCSRSEQPLLELSGTGDITTVSGGYLKLNARPSPGELGIVATPVTDLAPAARHLAECGFRKLLIEKPVSLWSEGIQGLATTLEKQGVEAACAYNRMAYPSFVEARARSKQEGGITSCTYTFTEWVDQIRPDRFTAEEQTRWGIANSLHVMSMAHGLIGLPESWSSHRSGSIGWHPAGSVFVGSGLSRDGIPFAWHADWGSKGRWSVEVHTSLRSYRMCPLEKLFAKSTATGEWEEVALVFCAPEVKAGILEQVAAMLSQDIRQIVPLLSLEQAVELTEYGEGIFGYPSAAPS
jgi:predicted dehydrogenase